MALTYSLDDFTVSFFVTGNGFSVLSVEVYAMARKGISMEINAISTIIFIAMHLATQLIASSTLWVVSKAILNYGSKETCLYVTPGNLFIA